MLWHGNLSTMSWHSTLKDYPFLPIKLFKLYRYLAVAIKKIAGMPLCHRQPGYLLETRGFPSLPFDRFGFV